MTMIAVHIGTAALAAFFILFSGQSLSVAGTFPNQWRNVSFETPTAFSKPVDAGMDAVAFTAPPDSKPGNARMTITLVAVPKDMKESFGNSDAEVLNYIKTTFLGASNQGKPVERSFLGRKVVGESLASSIPKKVEHEVFLVPLANGDAMALALTRDMAVPADEAEATQDMIARSFKETGGK